MMAMTLFSDGDRAKAGDNPRPAWENSKRNPFIMAIAKPSMIGLAKPFGLRKPFGLVKQKGMALVVVVGAEALPRRRGTI